MKYVYFVRGEKHKRLALTSIESAKKADPSASVLVMTDEPGFVLPVGTAEIGRIAPGMPIMLANLEAQIQAIGRYVNPSDPVTFLDTDTLVLKPLPIEAADDLVITWRDRVGEDEKGEAIAGIAVTMPYNYGVIGARPTLATLESLIFMRERVRQMNKRLQQWYGNQVALAALAGPRPDAGARTDVRRIPWSPTSQGVEVRVCKLPCDTWNYTPAQVGERIHEKRSILHFKGGRLPLMESYAKRVGVGWHLQEAAA